MTQGGINHMAEAAYAAGPALLSILGGPALLAILGSPALCPKKVVQWYFVMWNPRDKSIVSYFEVSYITTISSTGHATYQLGD